MEASIGGAGEGGISTGAPGAPEPPKTTSKPCSSTSSAPWRGARGSSSRNTMAVRARWTRTDTRIARAPRAGRLETSQAIGRRPASPGPLGLGSFGSARRITGKGGPGKILVRLGAGPSCRLGALCYINLARRVSTGVVQLICNQKVGGSNPSPGTSGNRQPTWSCRQKARLIPENRRILH